MGIPDAPTDAGPPNGRGAAAAPDPGPDAPVADEVGPAGASRSPHSAQNFALGTTGAPQPGQTTASGVPHSLQNLPPGRFSAPQLVQVTLALASYGVRSSVPNGGRSLEPSPPEAGAG